MLAPIRPTVRHQRVRYILTLMFALTSIPTTAAQLSCSKPSVFFVNGVWNNSPRGAQDSADALSKAIAEKFEPYGVQVRTIYNPGDGTLEDVAEVAISQNWIRSALDFIINFSREFSPRFSSYLQTRLDEAAASERHRAIVDDIKGQLLADIRTRQSTAVVIAHSEGNIYVNEAVWALKHDSVSRDIPGVQGIAVLGVGVADNKNKPGMRPLEPDLYRYLTSSDDVIINPLTGVPPANFFQSPAPGSHENDPSGHQIIDSYLSGLNFGAFPKSSPFRSARTVVVQLFDEVFNASGQASPCISLGAMPTSLTSGQEATLTVAALNPISGKGVIGAVSLETETGDAICANVPLDASGNGSCKYRFEGLARVEKVRAKYQGHYFGSVEINIGGADFRFEVAESGSGAGTSCTPVTVDYGGGQYTADRCGTDKSAVIRCVGTGCTKGRFYAAVSSSLLVFNVKCIFHVGGCEDRIDTQKNYGVDAVGTQTYALGSPYWFALDPNGQWNKVWPSQSPINPGNVLIYRNVMVTKPQSEYGLALLSSASLDVGFRIYDTTKGTYTDMGITVTQP